MFDKFSAEADLLVNINPERVEAELEEVYAAPLRNNALLV